MFRDSRLAALTAALFVFAFSALGASFTASLDRETANVGESVTLSLSFEGGSPKTVPILPTIPNLRIGHRGQSSHFNLVNGQMSSTVTYTYELTPTQVGDYTIPSLKTEVGGQTFTSPPLELKVTRNNNPPINNAEAEKQLAFLRIAMPKKEMFVGEVMTLELQLYLSSAVSGVNDVQPPQIQVEGLSAGNAVKGSERDVRINNTLFRVVQILIPITAIKPGEVTLGPLDCILTLQLPSNNRDPFDPLGIFGRAEMRRVTVSTQAETLKILDLPKQGVPEGFTGAVGNYSMNVTANPKNVAVGDPITVKIQINGRGPLDSLAFPEQTTLSEFKTYPVTSKVDATGPLGLQGTKTFEQIIVPQSADIKQLPPISFSFFDPDERKYHTLTNAPIPLVVKPGGAAPQIASLPGNSDRSEPPAQDIVQIKQRLGQTRRTAVPLISQGWFLSVQTIPVLAFLGLLAWRKNTERLANNPRLRRERHVQQTVTQGLQELKYYAAENYSEEFFATTFRLLQEQLGLALDLPASAITESVIEERLRNHSVPESLKLSLRELFQECNQARYAPGHKHGELQSLIPKVESVIAELRNLKLK